MTILAGVLALCVIVAILGKAPAAAQEQPNVGPCFSDLRGDWYFELGGVPQGPYPSRSACEAARAPHLPDTATPTATSTPAAASTSTATSTRPPVQRNTPTATSTATLISAPVQGNTPTATPTSAPVQGNTPTATPTSVSIQENTPTATPTATPVSPPVQRATPTPTPVLPAHMDSSHSSQTGNRHGDMQCWPNHAGRPLAICPNGGVYLFGAPSYEMIPLADGGIMVVTSYADGKPYVFILRGDEVEIIHW
ncbi:MAG: hypothetical protein OXH93_00220 [Caldilineaceae bacterium]|nr:hypothetical protein [Caldilineaceae bacterium]MDE0460796.1 hypothetical protein [Caldilineaceae bacterium]